MSDWKSFLQEFDGRHPLPPLHPDSVWDEDLSEEILSVSSAELLGQNNAKQVVEEITKVGFLVWNDDLPKAHDLIQNVNHVVADYWHAILHRREGDYDNAKYWFARVGEHPVFASVYQQAERLWPKAKDWSEWSPSAYVDAVAMAVAEDEHRYAEGESLRRVQVVEFSFLLRYGINL